MRRFGYEITSIAGDGYCCYTSILSAIRFSRQVATKVEVQEAVKFRLELIDYMEAHPEAWDVQ
eukprot:1175268-Rhodomonas_salina.1